MEIPIYQVDAFTSHTFGGNPAAVCPLESWLPDDVLLNIAKENNLAETAFFIPSGEGYHLRWFTPEIEMDLCGHATLASAHVLFHHLGYVGKRIRFESESGPLFVEKNADLLTLDFPSRPPKIDPGQPVVLEGIGGRPEEVLLARDYLLVYPSEKAILDLKPDERVLGQINLDPGGIIVTAPGEDCDFVSRFFTPGAVIFEDPVTGSAHCTLIPYWAKRLGKTKLHAFQISERRGELFGEYLGDRVSISGRAITYLVGQVFL